MSQRESPVTDPVAGFEPALSSALRRLLGLPREQARGHSTGHGDALKTVLSDLQTGQSVDLPAYTPEELSAPKLSSRQQEAVARALGTPDLFLIQGAAGTGKSLVVSEILHQATRRGLRVLFLAATSAALDRALETLAGTPDFAAVRCPGEAEIPDRIPPCVRKMALDERVRHFETETLGAARHEVSRLKELLATLPNHTVALAHLLSLLSLERAQAANLASLSARRQHLPENLDGPTGPDELAAPWSELQRTRDEVARQQIELGEQLARCREREQATRAELDTLKPLLEARQAGRWWSPAFWRGKGDVQVHAATLEQSCRELHAAALRAHQEADQLQARLREQTEAVSTALERRRAELAAEVAALEAEQGCLRARWQTEVAALPEPYRPAAADETAIRAAQARIETDSTVARDDLALAERNLAGLEEARIGLTERLAEAIPVVAATLGSLRGDPHYGTSTATFDLLVLDEAEQTTEADFLAVAERARRWVLIGEPTRHPDTPRRHAVARSQRPAHLRPGFFQRLWSRLHDDPSGRRVAWRADLERLVCVLETVPPEQERWIQPEPVVDRPDITLHIYSPPRHAPRLVEVEFAAGTQIDDAKAFVFQELDELPLQTRARCIGWDETPERILVQFGGDLPGKSKPVTLNEGVVEVVHLLSGHWQTARLEFDRAAGWTREKAAAWLRQRLHLSGKERTLLLDRPYRQTAPLASWLADLQDEPRSGVAAAQPCVEFVTVPSLSDDRPGRRFDHGPRGGGVATLAPKLKALRGGAGVEINLAEPRRHDLLPPELRDVLPAEGLVNYLEAQAVVRLVRELVGEATSRNELLEWQHRNASGCAATVVPCSSQTHAARAPGIAVMALFPAQVQLIRHLLAELPTGPVHIEVGLPDQMRHRECAVAVVALTRSHAHRAVAYGENPAQLLLAMTRASRRLVLVGDPGTLLRRSQFGEAVDHLDETESEQELILVSRLVRYLQGHGSQQRAFTIRELAGL